MIGNPRCDRCYGSGHIKKCGTDGRMIFTRCNLTVQYDIRRTPVDPPVWDDFDDELSGNRAKKARVKRAELREESGIS